MLFSHTKGYTGIYMTHSEELFMPGFESLFELYDGNYSMGQINDSIWAIAQSDYQISSL